jgi:5-methylcytosine-specific restriction endonuclease McrA
VEHITPRSKGGDSTLDNLALACQGCNNHKYNRTHVRDPLSEAMVPLYHPRRDAWDDHFAWSQDYSLIVGLTPIGRATVEVLQLNREGVVNLRRALFTSGHHPPPQRSASG